MQCDTPWCYLGVMDTWRPHLLRAVQIAGGQNALARKAGCSQTSIYKLVHTALSISGEMALRIERATAGKVTVADLRPDLVLVPTPAHADAA